MKHLTDTHLRILEKQEIQCTDVVELFGDYVDHDLTPTLRRRVTSHMRSCEDCQEFKNSYLRVIKLAAELRNQKMPRDVQNRLRSSLNQKLGLNIPLL